MQEKRFQRTREDFECERCHSFVAGNGYTNHCPKCLWSKHVDINPGDRANPCRGLMRPSFLDQSKGRFVIVHKCERCGVNTRVTAADADDFEAILGVAKGNHLNG